MSGIQGQPGTKPTDINAPVPGASEVTSFDQFEPTQAKATGQAVNSFDQFAAQSGQAPAAPVAEASGGALDTAGRVLDYPGGFTRAGLAEVAGIATGKPNLVTPEDLKAAAVGKGPNSAEYLRRLGVSEGGSLTLPGLGRVTLRGAEGLAFDVLTDPLTLIARTVKEIPYISKLLNAPNKASEALGEAAYKSAITAKDSEKAAKAGQALIDAGAPVGGQAKLDAAIAQTATTMGKIRQGLYDQFTQLGGQVDMPKDAFKNSEGVLANLRKNPTMHGLADEFEAMLNQYKGEGFVDMERMSQWKTQLYDSLPKNAFNGAKLANPGKMFKAALANDFKNLIVDSGNKVEKGLGDAINKVNDKWGALLESSGVPNGGAGTLGKMIDAAAFGVAGLPGLLKKKAFDLAIGPYGRTIVGKALMDAGKQGVAGALTRQALIKPGQPDQPSE